MKNKMKNKKTVPSPLIRRFYNQVKTAYGISQFSDQKAPQHKSASRNSTKIS